MLTKTIQLNDCCNINQYRRLVAFLKKEMTGYKPERSKPLTREEIQKYLEEAPDDKYLGLKVVTVLGLSGGLRRQEIHNFTMKDIIVQDIMAIINIPETKTNVAESFAVSGIFFKILPQYLSLRPPNMKLDNFSQKRAKTTINEDKVTRLFQL